jgi:hypothetical protein
MRALSVSIAFSLLLGTSVFAAPQATAPPPALLAPILADKPDGDYGPYLTYAEMQGKIADWARTHPELVQVSSLGKTFEGRDIPLVRLSAVPVNGPDSVPEVLFLSGIHPREQQPQIGIAALVDEFLASYGKDASLTKLLKERVIWIVPVFNVDGKVYDMQHGDGKTRGADWRKNRHPNPDGKTVGVDLNRNWGVRWGGNHAIDPSWNASTLDGKANIYEGAGPLSEPEDKALATFIQSRQGRLRLFLDIHSPLHAIYAPTYLAGAEYYRYQTLLDGMRTRQKQPYKTTDLKLDGEPEPGARGGDSGLTYTWIYYTQGVYAMNMEFAPPTVSSAGVRARYAPPAEIDSEYQQNIRGPLLYLIDTAGTLPTAYKATSITAVPGNGTTDKPATPGAMITWTPPALRGDWSYSILVSEGPEVFVPSEYRKAPLSGGFTIQIDPKAKSGTKVPMSLYVWDKNRGVIRVPVVLTVGGAN